jgi:hypothetical protein
MADMDEELLLLADGIRTFIRECGGYEQVYLLMKKSVAVALADRIEEWCKHGEKDAANL